MIVGAIFLISFLGFAITLPLGVKTVLGDMKELINTVEITPEKELISADVQTLDIDFDNYYYFSNNILVKQSPDETAYIERYNTDTYDSQFNAITITYPDEYTAKISIEPVYGKFRFQDDTIQKTIVKEIQNYPDAILYIPKTINIQTEYPHYFDSISFQNKQQLLQQADAEQKAELEQQHIEQMAEELLEQRRQEEEIIRQKAEELLIEREQQEQIEEGSYEEDYDY